MTRVNATAAIALLATLTLAPLIGAAQNGASRESPERAAHRAEMRKLGLQYATAADLYAALKQRAGGGHALDWRNMPDWTGLWTWESHAGFKFDPDTPPGVETTAKLTPEYQKKFEQRLALLAQGKEYDPLSACHPPGFPRWMAIPFLREFIVRPEETWLTSETVNNVRRIYTDGRGHMPEDLRYPLYYGDSIGFWDGDKLVIHTNQIKANFYQRGNPDHSEQTETVEIWQKTDERTIEADIWVYDPPSLVEPWYVRHTYRKVPNEDKLLRIRYWDCGENPNNDVYETQDGSSQFKDFTFDGPSDAPTGKP
jgi:hypothetical protein